MVMKIKTTLRIVGRHDEIETLEQMYASSDPEFLAVYGRRRVGKTYLIREFFSRKNAVFFNVTGSKNGSMREQIEHVTFRIGEVFYNGAKITPEKNWDKTFGQLTKAFSQISKSKKIVIFFDEIPWMATKRARLLQVLDYYWNQYWSNDRRIKLIICGSSASWIINNVLRSRGGLYNRVTRKIALETFNLPETRDFLRNVGLRLNNQQILLLYMVTGGVPYYLKQACKGLTAMQLIEKLAFSKKAILLDEFDELFNSLFDDGDTYTQIVRVISQHRYGIGQRKLLKAIGEQVVGGLGVKKLKDLEEAGFIMSFKPIYHKKQGIYYRLIDEYTLFYLNWIEPIKNALHKKALSQGNWQEMQNTPEWNSWLGYAFEIVCYKHLDAIRKTLQISPTAIAGTWRYVPKKYTKEKGAQIDLLFDRKDNATTICEIKYSSKPYVITKDYIDNIKRKMEVFQKQTRTGKQLFFTMITTVGLQNNYYAEDICDGVVTLEDLFS